MLGLDLDSWNLVMLVSLGIAALAAVAVVVSTTVVIKLQKQEAIDSAEAFAQYKVDAGVKIAEASEGAAKANERAAEANLALEKLKAPRTISLQEQQLIISKVSKFTGQEFDVTTFPDLKETLDFSRQLSETLATAGWKFIQFNSSSWPLPGTSGVHVFVHINADQKVKDAANALVSALEAAGKAPTLKHMDPQSPKDNKITLSVGTKP